MIDTTLYDPEENHYVDCAVVENIGVASITNVFTMVFNADRLGDVIELLEEAARQLRASF